MFIRYCVLQYVIVKVVLSCLAIALHAYNVYQPGSFDPHYGYLWISLAMNLSIIIAMYYLIVFYAQVHTIAKQFHPLRKLVAIKLILFFLFWQEVLLALLYYSGVVPSLFIAELGGPEESASVINNMLICIEMLLLSVAHSYVFPYEYYKSVDATLVSEDDIALVSFNRDDTTSQQDIGRAMAFLGDTKPGVNKDIKTT